MRVEKKIFFRGGGGINETELYHLDNGFIQFRNVKLVLPKEKDVRLFKDEFFDIILPEYCENFDYSNIEDLLGEGPYELNENVSIQQGDVVFDCGANMGMFSAAIASKAGQVYSFEPSKVIISEYLDPLSTQYSNIHIANYALSDHKGQTVFKYNVNNIGASSLNANENDNCIEEDVSLMTVDEFVEENDIPHVDFIKADIEGAERNMLMGATRVLKEFAPKLSICTYHLPDDKEVLEKIIKDTNPDYVVEHKYKKLYAYVPKS